jgi:2-enoate reductase
VNPDVLLQNQPQKAVHPKKVMVVGAGPGGITAALTAAQRGHIVSLYERDGEIGGKLIPGNAPDFKHEFEDLLRYFRQEVKNSSVVLNTNCTVTPSLIREKAPDVLVIATGAEPFLPAIPGIDRNNVLHATEVLINAHHYENRKVVIIGGGDVGCETAVLIARRDNDVSIVEMLPALMETEEIKHNTVILEQLILEAGVKVYTSSTVTEITDNAVLIRRSEKEILDIQADLVVLATGYAPAVSSVMELQKACRTTYVLGDCIQPGRLRNAISEGYRIGLHI